jgi:hypothetical protein
MRASGSGISSGAGEEKTRRSGRLAGTAEYGPEPRFRVEILVKSTGLPSLNELSGIGGPS